MGLLIFRERSANDTTPFKRNEFSVGAPNKAKAARSPIRRDAEPRGEQQHRRSRTRERLLELARQGRLPVMEPNASSASSRRLSQVDNSYLHVENTMTSRSLPPTNVPSRLGPNSHLAALLDGSSTRPSAIALNVFAANRSDPDQVSRSNSDRSRFAPAHHYWEENDANRSNSSTPGPYSQYVRPVMRTTRARPTVSARDSLDINRRSEQLRREAETGLYLDGASDPVGVEISSAFSNVREAIGSVRESIDAARAGLSSGIAGFREAIAAVPNMRINPSDGLGDRRRSVSQEGSPVEENWTSLFSTIPPDEHLPSASSSFTSASASASSSLSSRGHARSSLTGPTAPETRATSAEISGSPTTDAYNCPEPSGQSHSSDNSRPNSIEQTSGRALERSLLEEELWHRHFGSSSRRPLRERHSSNNLRNRRDQSTESSDNEENHDLVDSDSAQLIPREEVYRHLRQRQSQPAEERLDRFEGIDSILNRMEQQQPVPEEMWVSAGLTPHLGLRGGADRIMQRQRL